MTDPGKRLYVIIVDRSGSMRGIHLEAQNGIREFVREQAELPGIMQVSLYQFDDRHETVYDFADPGAVAGYELRPRGLTRLLDACGFAVTQVGERLAALPEHERPGKVVVLIATDGDENDSREYTKPQVKEMFTQQQDVYGWEFSYIGANVDAFSNARDLGIPVAAAMDYAATPGGTAAAYASASSAVTRSVCGQSVNIAYTDQERDQAGAG